MKIIFHLLSIHLFKYKQRPNHCNELILFCSDLSPNTAELLFEIYDRANKANGFLGLGIVGVEELLINPSQRQVISLQSRPYEADEVSGTLTVEVSIQCTCTRNIGNMKGYIIQVKGE